MRSLVYLPSTTSSDIVASPSLATSQDCRTAPQRIKPYSLTSTSHSVVFPIPPGVVGLVAHVADGSTKSETTPARHVPTSRDRPLDAVIVDERRDGPRWLCDDDNDDDDLPHALMKIWSTRYPTFHLARHVTSRHDSTRSACRASRDECVERIESCCSNMADDEQAIVLVCTSLAVFMF